MDEPYDATNYYQLVPEQGGMCLVGNIIINLSQVSLIHQTEGKTLVYYQGVREPVILPVGVFDEVRDAVFTMEDDDDDFEDDDDDDDDGGMDGDSHIFIVHNEGDENE